ncbi:MAG: flippase-like domain-containing protein [Saprospiraceae bacterium]|nr:flippase-like domain-containing protein [Saprospiraceae bacterium]
MSEEQTQPLPTIEAEGRRVVRSFRLRRMILPIALGITAVGFLFYYQFDLEQFRSIEWTGRAFAWIGLAFLILVVRHLFYTLRLRTITGDVFSWRKCLELVVLWEFSAALTPTSKGGPFVMLFVLTKEKLAAGRTAAAVLYTMVLDSGFFVVTLPILLLLYGPPMLYPGMKSYSDVGLASGTFFVTYGLMLTYWSFIVFLLLIKPRYAKKALGALASLPFLKKWSARLHLLGEEFALAAEEIHRRDWRYHLKVIVGTVGAWTSKFIMINCLIIAIMPSTPVDGATQAFIYARMVAMFIIMAFSPTPGGAGLAEVALVGFISDYVPAGIGLVVALLWRGMAYYGYLLLGAVVVPAWVAANMRMPKRGA